MPIESHLREDWTPPAVPPGFDQLCAFENDDGSVDLDFVNHERRDFASETGDVDVQWPWVDGYRPTPADWGAAGFCFITSRHVCG